MANWLSKLFSAGALSFAEGVAGIADRFIQTPEEKAQFTVAMEQLMQARDSELEQTIRTELVTKERIMVAELQSGDNYTRRARPTLVYFGMLVIALNYVVLPWAGFFTDGAMPPLLEMPTEFWYAWGGTVSVWFVGRSMERRGAKNNLVSIVTGNQPTTSILDN